MEMLVVWALLSCFNPTVYSPPMLRGFGKRTLLNKDYRWSGVQAVQASYSFPKNFSATGRISKLCLWVRHKENTQSSPLEIHEAAAMKILQLRIKAVGGFWSSATGLWISKISTAEKVIEMSPCPMLITDMNMSCQCHVKQFTLLF